MLKINRFIECFYCHLRSGWYYFWSRRSICVCLCVCVCPVRALTFESLDQETSFLVRRYIFRISRPSSYVKVIGSRSRSHDPKNGTYERSRVVRLRLEGKLGLSSFQIRCRVWKPSIASKSNWIWFSELSKTIQISQTLAKQSNDF